MERRNFLKRIGLGALFATAPSIVKSNDNGKEPKTYRFDEIFYRPFDGNTNLIYVKNDSSLARKIYSIESGVDENFNSEFSVGTYYPVRDVLIEYKDEYVEGDFNGLISYLKNRSNFTKLIPFVSDRVGKSPMRFILNKNGYMETEFLSHWVY